MSNISSEPVGCLVTAGLQERILLPTVDEYTARIDSYFNNGAKLKPACIFMPESTAEVATAVRALVESGTKFAIRSGGSNFWPSNNISDGVTIDLGRLNSINYDPETETAKIGAGVLAAQVCFQLSLHGLANSESEIESCRLTIHNYRLTKSSGSMKGQ